MNIVDDTDGPLDPRIQIELEKLNNATDDINKLEIELDEATTAYNRLLFENNNRLKECINKLGSSVIDKARIYHDVQKIANEANLKCQEQAHLFQKAYVEHKVARETVAVAEKNFMSHQHEWKFDQAWQDAMNRATLQVTETEKLKTKYDREYLKYRNLFEDAVKKVQQLEEKYRKSIIKAEPYFSLEAQYEQKLMIQKEVVECLRKAVKDAKCAYAASLNALEEISNQIHERREMITKGPREPGVGAELETFEDNSYYTEDLNKVHLNKDETEDIEDVRNLREQLDNLETRSVDGSESNSNQWEGELQAGIENLNNSSINVCENIKTDNTSSLNDFDLKAPQESRFEKPSQNEAKESTTSKNSNMQLPPPSPLNSIINRSKIAFMNSFSKSLTNSSMNIGSFSFGKSKSLDSKGEEDQSHQVKENIKRSESLDDSTKENHQNYQNCKPTYSEIHSVLTQHHDLQNISKSKDLNKVTHSLDSTPVRNRSKSTPWTLSSINVLSTETEKDISKQSVSSSLKTKEFPLLSFFQKSTNLMPQKNTSSSMINLNEKQHLKTLLDNSALGNLQAASVEKLANARHKLVGES
ncbi:SH3 domain-binding protein 5 homolog [Trichogramma pretiosum]|uniref:SH3 domain-binding protein 5 homolog n=1 Tax=Trichogramma pretiosum TaxID=7493 RepID=UPI0006C9BD47|nr:SH3 domain-binding protein 5 homolog [Trichogramma pretiosum]